VTYTDQQVEFLPTSAWAVLRFLEDVQLPGGRWLEPCVGGGSIVKAVNSVRSDVEWVTLDIKQRPEFVPDRIGNYLQLHQEIGDFDVVMFNPPFTRALEFVQLAYEHAKHVCMFQRLNWIANGKRAEWIRSRMPGLHILPNRPGHLAEKGSTDMQEYAWFLWPRQYDETRILATTASNIRKRDRLIATSGQDLSDRQLSLFEGAKPQRRNQA